MTCIDEFLATIARLRGPNGCPWDKEQDHLSLARYLLEETYEVLEAIHSGEPDKLKEELGDLLLQIALHAQIAKDNGQFDMQDVAAVINAKMVKRHPHVFGDTTVENAEQVVRNWEALKQKEAKEANANKSIVDNVPNTLPALLKALKVSEKAVSIGFEWDSADSLWEKVLSEIEELKVELRKDKTVRDKRKIEMELGDVLFCLVNVARWEKLNPEESLLLAIDKFRHRFREMEKMASGTLKDKSLQELNDLWEKAKANCADQ